MPLHSFNLRMVLRSARYPLPSRLQAAHPDNQIEYHILGIGVSRNGSFLVIQTVVRGWKSCRGVQT